MTNLLLAEEDLVPRVAQGQVQTVRRELRHPRQRRRLLALARTRRADLRHGQQLRRLRDQQPHDRKHVTRRLPARLVQRRVPALLARDARRHEDLVRRRAQRPVHDRADRRRPEDDDAPGEPLGGRQPFDGVARQDLEPRDDFGGARRQRARGLDDAEERAGLEDRAERGVRERREARRAAARPEGGLRLIGFEPWRRDTRRRATARFEDGLLPVVPQEFELGRPARASLARFALLDRFAGQCSRADRPCSGVRQGEDHREALHQHVLEGLLATCRTREAEFCLLWLS